MTEAELVEIEALWKESCGVDAYYAAPVEEGISGLIAEVRRLKALAPAADNLCGVCHAREASAGGLLCESCRERAGQLTSDRYGAGWNAAIAAAAGILQDPEYYDTETERIRPTHFLVSEILLALKRPAQGGSDV